jgi:hypothetical protein
MAKGEFVERCETESSACVLVAFPGAVPGGVWLALAGFAWVILSLTGVLLPQVQDKVDTYSQPAFFGEIALMVWLAIKGAKPPALDATASSSVMRHPLELHD